MASVIAVSNGLGIVYWKTGTIDPFHAALTYVGVIFLHASVDLLNDFWDHKRGIDGATKRTRFSGGTGVLPENLLSPKKVFGAGMIFLILGASIGTYFVLVRGITIAIILCFAVVAIYFYSTSIVNVGLGELFVAIKGAMIVLGTFYVQSPSLDPSAIFVGITVGILSATVLFVNSFPDFEADKSKGRRTLVILLGRNNATTVYPLLIIAVYAMVIVGIFFGLTKVHSILALASAPFAAKSIMSLKKDHERTDELVKAMASAVMYSRTAGLLLALSFIF